MSFEMPMTTLLVVSAVVGAAVIIDDKILRKV